MRLHLHARDSVVDRQRLERVDERMIVTVLQHERRDDRAHLGHLSAREALVSMTLEPEVGIAVARVRPYPGERIFQAEREQPRSRRGIDRLPHRVAEARLTALPHADPDFAGDEPVLEQLLVVALPDAFVVVAKLGIDAEETAASQAAWHSRKHHQQQYRGGCEPAAA